MTVETVIFANLPSKIQLIPTIHVDKAVVMTVAKNALIKSNRSHWTKSSKDSLLVPKM
jgi:hypothetical protein